MQKTLLMDNLQRLKNRLNHPDSLILRNRLFSLEVIGKRFALKKFHDDIGSIVFLEAVENLYYTRFILEFGEMLCLFNEFPESVAELVALFAIENGYLRLSRHSR